MRHYTGPLARPLTPIPEVRQGNRVQRAILSAICRRLGWNYYWFVDGSGRRRLRMGDDNGGLRITL